MAIKDYINNILDNKYIINIHSASSSNYVTTFPSSSIIENVLTQSVTQSVLNNYLWTNATGTAPNHSEWTIISGTDDIAALNPNGDGTSTIGNCRIGSRVEIRGNEIFTNLHTDSTSIKHNGVVIFKSSSLGWELKDYINAPTSSGDNTIFAGGLARDFSLYKDHLAISAYETGGNDSMLHIFKSSSASGWSLEQTLTTASYNDGASVDVSTGTNTFLAVKLYGDKLVTSGFSNGQSRYLGIFASGTGGWAFEDSVFIRDGSTSGGASNTGGSVAISNVALDFDGSRIIAGSNESPYPQSYRNEIGSIYIIQSSSDGGWELERKMNLQDAGLTDNKTSTFGSNYTAEYMTFRKFGAMGCSISGSYAVASAEGQNIYVSSLSNYRRQRNSTFIFKSSSSGWNLEKRLIDPTTDFVEIGGLNDTTNTEFGLGVKIKNNSVFVNSPAWRSATSASFSYPEGRAYIYVSSSSTEWPLTQTVENPFSGSTLYAGDNTGVNHGFVGNTDSVFSAGEVGYGVSLGVSASVLALGSPRFTRNSNEEVIKGAIVVLNGTSSFVDQIVDEYITESVSSTTNVTRAGGSVPFRFSSKGAFNLRGQNAKNHYKTFVGDQKN